MARSDSESPDSGARPPLLAVVGPTSVGKTALAVSLAARLDGEIVNADSRQVYRGMEIGTAQPSIAERSRVPHHLFSFVDPEDPFSLALYLDLARRTIGEIVGRDALPILVGGSGLYVRAILSGMVPPRVEPDLAFRNALEGRAAVEGAQALHSELMRADPVAAAAIDPRNVRRTIRALEVIRATGRPFSDQAPSQPPPYDTIRVGLTLEREVLYQRIDRRVEAMFATGLLEEAARLRDRGLDPALPALSSLGYREAFSVLGGALSVDLAIEQIKRQTRRFARQQYTWFQLDDQAIAWFDADRPDLLDSVLAYLAERRT
ncbi:MAG: tRNA (adenosine(37)-N6)-dimethylallyltransferase MiaA [Dehalococcoidia bacterium]